MVMQLQLCLGRSGLVNSAYTKWKRRQPEEQTWTAAKAWFRDALADTEQINQLSTGEAGLMANAAVAKDKAAEEVCQQIAE